MSVFRAFIAIELPKNIYLQLENVLETLQSKIRGNVVRWVPAQNIHLTLMFLGDVSQSNVSLINDSLRSETSLTPPMEISLGGIGAFPSMNRPRVIWVGVEAPANLFSLQRRIAGAMERLGYKKEDRPFSPHLTMGRISRFGTTTEIRRVGEELNQVKIGFLGIAVVQYIHLYRSDLNPGGPRYNKIMSFRLSSTD